MVFHRKREEAWLMVKKFKLLRSVDKSYTEQGYIYFCCLNYGRQPQHVQNKIDALCERAGGEYAAALKAFLCTGDSFLSVCVCYHVSEATLGRARNRFYRQWQA
jgi:hypothetical protein